jgi:hypothetical protein
MLLAGRSGEIPVLMDFLRVEFILLWESGVLLYVPFIYANCKIHAKTEHCATILFNNVILDS